MNLARLEKDISESSKIDSGQWQRLLDISARLSSTLELQPLLSLVIDVAAELTDTITGSILLVEPNTGELHFVVTSAERELQNIVVPQDSIAGWIVRTGESIIIDDVQSDTRFYTGVDNTTQFITENMLGVPLRTKDHIIGALEVINKRDNACYSPQDEALLEALASQAAIAIENARLFEQSDLIAEIMHELKTPLMAITSASELVLRRQLTVETDLDLVQMIHDESIRMSKMTKDFLDLAQMESGRSHLRWKEVNLEDVVCAVIRTTKAQAKEHNVKVSATLPEKMPAFHGDELRIQQALLNLVSNAIKYNCINGEVAVTIKASSSKLTLSVRDTGIGMAQDNMNKLFERFYRVPGSPNKSEGSGLGLAIAKKIVEEHGGTIQAMSSLGEGSIFTCIFPL